MSDQEKISPDFEIEIHDKSTWSYREGIVIVFVGITLTVYFFLKSILSLAVLIFGVIVYIFIAFLKTYGERIAEDDTILDNPIPNEVAKEFKEKITEEQFITFRAIKGQRNKAIYRFWLNLNRSNAFLYQIENPEGEAILQDRIFTPFFLKTTNGFFLQEIRVKNYQPTTFLLWVDAATLKIVQRVAIGFFKLETQDDDSMIKGINGLKRIDIKLSKLK